MTITELKEHKLLLLDCISGSKAYGLDTPQSDTDMKGVFLLSKRDFYGLEYINQVNNESNDEVYYELKRFVDLLPKNNPNILELINTPEDCIIYKHPVMDLLKPELFLSKLCNDTFAKYAQSQIKKAKGLNKKIVNPVDKARKSVIDFCYVIEHQGSVKLEIWLEKKGLRQQDCGLTAVDHMREVYALYHNSQLQKGHLRGVFSGADANDVLLSSVEIGIEPIAILSFNKDGFSKYCKDYREYWEWVNKRNDIRYQNTIEHGMNYDTKNMMHTFRLLNMAEEIAKDGRVNVRRSDREFLMEIRNGKYNYNELLELANVKVHEINELFSRSSLPDHPDSAKANEVLITMREMLYK